MEAVGVECGETRIDGAVAVQIAGAEADRRPAEDNVNRPLVAADHARRSPIERAGVAVASDRTAGRQRGDEGTAERLGFRLAVEVSGDGGHHVELARPGRRIAEGSGLRLDPASTLAECGARLLLQHAGEGACARPDDVLARGMDLARGEVEGLPRCLRRIQRQLYDLVVDGERVAALFKVLQAGRRLILVVGIRQRIEGHVGNQRQVDVIGAIDHVGVEQRQRLAEDETIIHHDAGRGHDAVGLPGLVAGIRAQFDDLECPAIDRRRAGRRDQIGLVWCLQFRPRRSSRC